MTNDDLTRSLIYLDSFDMDGLIDIARYGVDPTITSEVTQQLMQRLATAIVDMVAPNNEAVIRADHHTQTATNIENDESMPLLFSPGAALVVLPFQAGGTA